MSNSLRPHGLWPTWLLHPWDFPGKNTGVGCHFKCFPKLLIPAWRWSQCHSPRGRFTDCLKIIHSTSIKKQTESLFPNPSQQSQPAFEMSASWSCSALSYAWPRLSHLLSLRARHLTVSATCPVCALWGCRGSQYSGPSSTATNNPGSCCLALLTSAIPVHQLSYFSNSGCYTSW